MLRTDCLLNSILSLDLNHAWSMSAEISLLPKRDHGTMGGMFGMFSLRWFYFFLIELHFLNFILLGCAHIHLSVCEHLQRSQGDFLVLASLSTFTWAQSTRFAQQAPLLGPLPVFLSDIDSSL